MMKKTFFVIALLSSLILSSCAMYSDEANRNLVGEESVANKAKETQESVGERLEDMENFEEVEK